MDFPHPISHMPPNKAWNDCKPGWYEVIIRAPWDIENDEPGYCKIIRWLYENIAQCERHCIWAGSLYIPNDNRSNRFGMATHIKCRYERDYLWLKLAWG